MKHVVVRFWIAAALFACTLHSLSRAQTEAPPAEAPAAPGTQCEPLCRTGFVCLRGECVSACNPPCAENMQCTSYGECIPGPGYVPPPTPPPAAAPPPAQPPPAQPPAPPPQPAPMQWQAPERDTWTPPPESDDESVRFHDGFYLRLGIGAGAIGANAERNDVSDPTPLHLGGLVIPVEFAIGGTPSPGVVLGGGIYGLHIPAAHYTSGRGDNVVEEDADYGSIGLIAPFVDVYPSPRHGVHFQAAAGLTNVAPGESDTVVRGEVTGTGFGAMVGLGVESWVGEQWGMGVLARLQYASVELTDEDDNTYDFQMLVPSLLVTATLH